ncbi:hypothetical protein L1049_001670 [Liquidambar formosana]|uniref:Helicase MOV-10-like beta-barrel domain-containing protein n=1 Tax=Liquidambar formosana TaxID=63359 RepID=A0AAP0N400_LIQFO
MFFFVKILRKITGFFLSYFTGNHQRSDREALDDTHPFNHEDRGDYAILNQSSASSYNHQAHLASPDIRIGIHGEKYETSGPSNSASKVGNLPQIPGSIQPRSTSNIGNNNSAQTKPVFVKRPSEDNHEFHQKPKGISPLPPPPRVLHSKSVDPGTKRPVDSSLPNNLSPFSSQPPPFSFKPAPSSSQIPQSSLSLPLRPSPIQPPQFSSDSPPSSSRLPSSCSKPTLSPLTSNPTNQQKKANYVLVQTDTSPIYEIPEDFKDLIKKDIVPGVLKKPVSPLTYKDYFAALLYAEDYYVEKWNGFKLHNVTLKLEKAAIYRKSNKKRYLNERDEKDDKTFVVFEIDSVPERRPFLLSRDFVFVKPSGRKVEPFKGILYRVVKSTRVLVEFGEDFHSQHNEIQEYDVSFSFNRCCLKRAHQSVEAASDPLFRNFLFPNCRSRDSLPISPTYLSSSYKLDSEQTSAILRILSLKSPPPYVVVGQSSVSMPFVTDALQGKELSRTGLVVREAVLHIYRTSPKSRILVCAPTNNTCDVLMRSLKKEIRESDVFRANAAFREVDGVPLDILPLCVYKDECFTCPTLQEIQNFKVIFSTFVSSFRLHDKGITAGHFSHIFLVDASSTTEPEVMVPLTNLANEKTAIVVTGAPRDRTSWVRSDIARQNGLQISYFERLCESKLYCSSDPMFITRL